MSQNTCSEEKCGSGCSCGQTEEQPKLEEIFKNVNPTESQYIVYVETTETKETVKQLEQYRDQLLASMSGNKKAQEILRQQADVEVQRLNNGNFESRLSSTPIMAKSLDELEALKKKAEKDYAEKGYAIRFSDILHVESQFEVIKPQ